LNARVRFGFKLVGVNAWERRGQKLLFGAGEEEDNHWEMRWYKYPQIRICNGYFETPEPLGWIPEPPGTGDFSWLTWEQPRTSGKSSEVPGKKISRLSQLADGSFCGWDNFGF
jgi:hypothetical protein